MDHDCRQEESGNAGSAPKKVLLTFETRPGTSVLLAGTFNNWALDLALTDRDGNGVYTCELALPPGTYEYKFRVDEVWTVDPVNPNFTRNDFGTLNSVLTVD